MEDGGTVLLMWSIGLQNMGGYARWGDRTPDVEHWSTKDGGTVLLMWRIGLRQIGGPYS